VWGTNRSSSYKKHMEEMCGTVARKTFICKLPPLDEYQMHVLYMWAKQNCAEHRFLKGSAGIHLVCKRERARTCKMTCRLFRAACASLGIDLPKTRGWLHLIDDEQMRECMRAQPLPRAGSESERTVVLAGTPGARSRGPAPAPSASGAPPRADASTDRICPLRPAAAPRAPLGPVAPSEQQERVILLGRPRA
jgi:hypothetical protein